MTGFRPILITMEGKRGWEFTALKVPSLCPLVFLVKVDRKLGRTLENEEERLFGEHFP